MGTIPRTAILTTCAAALLLCAVFVVTIPWLIVRCSVATTWAQSAVVPCRLLGVVLIAFGVYLYVWSIRRLLGRETSALPGVAPTNLETTGWYGRVRHPLLLGVVAVLLGEAALFASVPLLAYALLYWLWLHLFVTFKEERDLQQAFGDAYTAYMRKVPRWIPRRWL
jgi:protein-S-isoprenylcysteine O-methyltransferase Ste14